MLIAHEAPQKIMSIVQSVTDYDYCLVHLLEENEEYLKFFEYSNRKVIMDCSLFELGEAFNPEKYYKWLLRIQPDEYIIPDVWQNFEENLNSYNNFCSFFDLTKLTGKKIGVLQGNTLEELTLAYKFMEERADKIAISFGYDFYLKNTLNHLSKGERFSEGRKYLINELLKNDVLKINKPHHLLGCGNPTEFFYYKKQNYKFIESVDTSHPVISGYFLKDYENKGTLLEKIPTKVVDVFEEEVTQNQLEIILKNIRIFRDYVH